MTISLYNNFDKQWSYFVWAHFIFRVFKYHVLTSKHKYIDMYIHTVSVG